MNNKSITYCADVIATLEGDEKHLVVIERLNSPHGLSFPGGKQEPMELLSTTAIREFKEETGLDLEITGVLGTYAEPGRDPRGLYVSTVFVGVARGVPLEYGDKTRIHIIPRDKLLSRKRDFVFDHFKILLDFLKA